MKNIFKRKEVVATQGTPKEAPTKALDANRPRTAADTQFTNFLKGIGSKPDNQSSGDKPSIASETRSDLKKSGTTGFVQRLLTR